LEGAVTEAERKIQAAREFIGARLGQIQEYFTEPVKVTLVVRNPAHPDGSRDFHMGDDDLEVAIAALRALEANPQASRLEARAR